MMPTDFGLTNGRERSSGEIGRHSLGITANVVDLTHQIARSLPVAPQPRRVAGLPRRVSCSTFFILLTDPHNADRTLNRKGRKLHSALAEWEARREEVTMKFFC
jgi:hypothetical protein